jgi:guanylate kinase
LNRIFIISGPSGSGKTTLCKRLLKDKKLKVRLEKAVTLTTRRRRHNEKNGRDYEFVTRKEFLKAKRAGDLLESQNIFSCLYGTSKKNVESLLRTGKDVVLVIDVKGEKAIKKIFPRAVSIFILPLTISVLKQRLKSRSTEVKKDLQKRLLIAEEEIRQSKRFDYVVVNDHLNTAVKKLKEIILA